MKTKLVLLTTIILVFALIFAACSNLPALLTNGSNSNDAAEESATGSVTEAEIEAAKEEVEKLLSGVAETIYLDDELVAVNEAQRVATVSEEGAVAIDLSTLTAESEIQGATFDGTTLTITSAGTYVLSGTLNGAVAVAEKINDTVRIVLNGAQINTLDSQAAASLLFLKTDALRVLTVADGSENSITYTVGEEATNLKGVAIQSKKSSLTINGSGTLSVVAEGGEANGIAVKRTLTILSANVTVSATKNGVKADELIEIKGATLVVTAGNDGIKTDIEPSDEEEALAYASDPQAGYIYIENSTITVTAGDDGIAANSCLYIANRAEDVITVTTNGGAPATVTERSSDAADGKALKVSGIVLEDEATDTETLYPATYPEESEIDNYALVITGGTFVINSNDDAIHSKGNVLVTGGAFTIVSGDDGVHAEYLTRITGGSLTVTKSYEGIEGASVEITGGEISVKAVDDGVNAANADLKNYNYNILITDGILTVNCSGDGVDSNGKLLISGGSVTVFGPENGGNSALDSQMGTTISGGNVITTCRESMDPVSSTQYKVVANVNLSANTQATLKDASGKVIASFITPKTCANVLISTPDMTAGTYTLTYGNNNMTLTASVGSTGGMGFGGGQGGMRQGGQIGGKDGSRRGSFGAQEDVTLPDLPDGETPSFDGAQPSEMPSGEMPEFNGEQPPALPDGEPSFDDDQPPMMPDGEKPSFDGAQPPEMPNGETPSFDGGQAPTMPGGEMTDGGMGQGGQPPMMPRGGFGQNGFGPYGQTA